MKDWLYHGITKPVNASLNGYHGVHLTSGAQMQEEQAASPQQPVDPVTWRRRGISVADIMLRHRSMRRLWPSKDPLLRISSPSPGAVGRGWSRQELDMLHRYSTFSGPLLSRTQRSPPPSLFPGSLEAFLHSQPALVVLG